MLYDAIAFDRGRVLATGSAREVCARMAPGAEVVDARGAFVCPGFVDPHVHVRAAALAQIAGESAAADNGAGILTAVSRAPRQGTGWITLVGAAVDSPLSGRAPDRRALDHAGRGRPVRVRADTGHGWLLSSSALRRIGVEIVASGRRELAPAGVAIERDRAGVATGFVADHVGWVGRRSGRLSSDAEQRQAVDGWSREAARRGVVAVCDATATNHAAEAQALVSWSDAGVLRQEVTFLSAPDARIGTALRSRLAGVKFSRAEDRRLPGALCAAADAGLRVAVHCIDPRETAAAIEAAAKAGPRARGALRIEHAAYVPPDWLPDVARSGATVVTHPSFIQARGDRYLADPLLQPPEWLYRLRSWGDAGIPLAFASDAPFGPVDPLDGLRAAAGRRTAAGRVIGAAEALCGERALAGVTTAAARVAGLDRLGYGTLATGGPGAAVVLSDDPRDPGALREVELVATVIGGSVVE